MRPYRLFLLGLPVAACLPAQTQPTIDNDRARVLTAQDEPHVKHALHEHKLNRVMIYLNAGDVKWTPATGRHTPEVTGSAQKSAADARQPDRSHDRKGVGFLSQSAMARHGALKSLSI